MTQSDDNKDGFNLETSLQNLDKNSWKKLSPERKFLVSVYHKWVQSAKSNCGTPFIAQAHKKPYLPTPGLNSSTETSLKVL